MSRDRLPITHLPRDGIAPDVLVCGDPERATRIADRLDDRRLLAERREYRSFSGRYQDRPISVCSHGIGSPGAAAAFEELIVAGARRLIRVGTCGSLQPDIDSGDLVIATAAVQHTGYGQEVAPEGYPAVADPDLTVALRRAAEAGTHSVHSGLVLTRDAFYPGLKTARTPDYHTLSDANVLCVEMECAALFLLGSLRGVQTGAILAVDGNVLTKAESVESYAPSRQVVADAVEAEITIALAALHQLSAGA